MGLSQNITTDIGQLPLSDWHVSGPEKYGSGSPWTDLLLTNPLNLISPGHYTETVQRQQNSADFQNNIKSNAAGIQAYDKISKILDNIGITGEQNKWATAQVMFETGGLKSRVSGDDNNFSGIKFINKPYQHATRGRKSPEGDYYAHYSSPEDWARDFRRVISLRNVKTRNSAGGPAAIEATSLRDYVNRLKANGYFGGNQDIYYQGLFRILSARGNAPAEIKSYEQATNTHVDKQGDINPGSGNPLKDFVTNHPLITGGIAIALGLVVIKKLMK